MARRRPPRETGPAVRKAAEQDATRGGVVRVACSNAPGGYSETYEPPVTPAPDSPEQE